MKKTLFFIATLLLAGAVTAQTFVSTDPSTRNVIIEEYTGVNCGYCPDGHRIANEVMAAHPGHAWAINIHQGGYAPMYTTQWGDALAAQIGHTGYPAGTVNRHVWGSQYQTNVMDVYRDYWPSIANVVVGMNSPVNVAARGTIDASTRMLELDVEVYYTGEQTVTSNMLNVALLQNNVIGPQSGASNFNPSQMVGNQYRHMHMLRDLLTGQWGEEITNLSVGHCVPLHYSYAIPYNIGDVAITDMNDLQIVVFVAEGHAEILTGAEAELEVINTTVPRINRIEIAHEGNCSMEFTPSLTLLNVSDKPVRNWVIEYNGETFTYEETVAAGQSATMEMPMSIIPSEVTEAIVNATDTAKFRLLSYTIINGENDEEIVDLDNALSKLEIFNEYMFRVSNEVMFEMHTDNYSSEDKAELFKQENCTSVWNKSFSNKIRKLYYKLSPAEAGLYILKVSDSYGDGMTYTNIEPGFKLFDGDELLYNNDGDFGSEAHVFLYFAEAGNGTFVGVDDVENVSFEVYPNPANDILNVRSNEAVRQLDIVDMTGRTVASANSNSVNVATLSAGVYIVRITTASGTGMQKIVKN